MTKVKLRDGESPDKLLRRFRKAVTRSGVMSEVRKRVGLFPEMSRGGWRGKKQFGATKNGPEEIKDMVTRA